MSKYILVASQAYGLEERRDILGVPNFYEWQGELMGLPCINFTADLTKAMSFNLMSQCRELIKNKKMTSVLIIKIDVATQFLIEYKNASKKRTEKYRITDAEIDILKRMQEAGRK